MAIIPGGKSAQTGYKILKSFASSKDPQSHISLIECRLYTGRTHQIRVHLQHLGIPIVGDDSYGKKPKKDLWPNAVYTFPRQALHAYSLAFMHPITQQQLLFQAPLAEDMQQLLNAFE